MRELDQRLSSHALLLETRTTPNPSELEKLAGVVRVEALGHNRVRLLFEEDNPADTVAACVASQGWGLVELSLDRQTLEQVFVDLTCSDAPAPSGVAA
jgi:ABC-2 type transport system ATP-binding protein